jgi:hypothetical protein
MASVSQTNSCRPKTVQRFWGNDMHKQILARLIGLPPEKQARPSAGPSSRYWLLMRVAQQIWLGRPIEFASAFEFSTLPCLAGVGKFHATCFFGSEYPKRERGV